MHPVIAKLDRKRRRALLACADFAALSESRKVQLLDEVMKIRASLDSDDKLDAFSDQRQRMADAAALKGALTIALTILGQHRQIGVDMIDGIADRHRGDIGAAMTEERACRATMRRMLETIERLTQEPRDDLQQRTRRRHSEAWRLFWALRDCGVRIVRTTPEKHGAPNSGLTLMGLLANPAISADAMRKRLRNKAS
jgi:hypothetical protein